MTTRTDKQAALDANAQWVLEELQQRWPGRLSLNSHEIGMELDRAFGPVYDSEGQPHPRKNPTELARRLVANGTIHNGFHGRIKPGKGGVLIVPLPALAASLTEMMLDPDRSEGWTMVKVKNEDDSIAIKQSRGPRRIRQ